MKRTRDKDILALKGAIRALDKSTSLTMLRANLKFVNDHYADTKTPKGYRKLRLSQIVKRGDMFWDVFGLKWRPTKCANWHVGSGNYIRKIKKGKK